MQVSFKIVQNLIWVFLAFPTFIYPSLSAPTSSELVQFCGPLKLPANSTISVSFLSNFINVMDSLLKQISLYKWGQFSVTTLSPEIHALAQCHEDLSIVDCILCFSQARVKLPLCLPAASAWIHLEGCFLRYDSYNFFRESINPKYDSVGCSDPTDVTKDTSLQMEFTDKVSQVIDNVTELALKNRTFATLDANVGVIPVYALAQCWTTLSEDECRNCLTMAGSKLRRCAPHCEGRALFTGCYMKYSTERFFENDLVEKANKESDTKIIIAIVLLSVAFVVLAGFGAFMGYRRLPKTKKGHKSLSRFPTGSNLNFEYEVLEQATDFFSDTRKLGQGGAGSVFKGTLPNGRTVAVKRLVYNTRQWVDQFFNEVNLISSIQHPNLVRLLGCSIEGPESLLVYEYVPNRSLDQMLFINDTKHTLSWEQRFTIILGTAEGLAYLHGGCGAKIVHRDIKTGNILLDENFAPKIADFGLARCAASGDSHISTGIAGTLGYMAPEYLMRGQLTEKADVYGFGVLVVEIATGKKNSVFSQGSSSILHSVWKNHKTNTITQTIFPGLMGEFPEKQAADVLRIGLLCTQASAALRPSMAEVVEMLTNQECEISAPKQPPFLNASVLGVDDSTESCITRVSLTNELGQLPTTETRNSHTPVSRGSSPSAMR